MNSEDEGFGPVGDLSRDLSTGVRVDTAYRTADPDPRDAKLKDLEAQLKVVQGSRDWHVDRVKSLEDQVTREREAYDREVAKVKLRMTWGIQAQARVFRCLHPNQTYVRTDREHVFCRCPRSFLAPAQ